MTTPAAALRELSARVLRAAGPDEVVAALADAFRDALGIDRLHVAEISQDAAIGHVVAVGFESGEPEHARYVQVFDDRPSGMTSVLASGEPRMFPDARSAPELRPDYVKRFEVASVYFFPLFWGDDVRHVAALITHEIRRFGDEELALAEALCNCAAATLALHESEARHAAQNARDAALARAARALNETLELPVVLETLAREADLAVGGDIAGIYVGDSRHGGVATAGHNTPPGWHGYLMKPGEGVAGQVLASGRPAISNAYQSDVQLPEQPGLRRLQTAVSVPMSWGGQLRGALSVGFVRFRRVTVEDLRTLEAIADLAAVACRDADSLQRAAADSARND